ncbi:MAG: Cache 3/Cache 2 fusion domain-containing protein, partial [Deltaproteobacteria bacterium]|nr:Cache 3/Cache 2 fusion domain-containing protein [Deltaproteobacteria bacterium]
MFKKMKLMTKLLVIGVMISTIPIVIIGGIIFVQNRAMGIAAQEECLKLAYGDLDHLAESVYSMCATQDELLGRSDEESIQSGRETLKKTIAKIEVGKTGYVYVLDSKGTYVVSKNGERDGENIWNARDSDGNLLIQEAVERAHSLGPNDIAEQKYPWRNEGDVTARMKIVRIKYYKPWDWIIGVGSYEDEFYEAQKRIDAIGSHGNVILSIIVLLTLACAAVVWFVVARGIAGSISRIVDRLRLGGEQVASASHQVSQSSQQMAEGSSEQASSLE